MSRELIFDDGLVKLGDTLLPGILVSQRIGCAVRIDTAQVEGQAQKTQTPLEWDNAALYLCLDLLTDVESDSASAGPPQPGTDCYEKLAALNRIFKGKDNGHFAQIYTVNSRHARARGLDKMIFSSLDSDEDDQDDVIRVSLCFVEYLPPKTAQKAAGIAGSGTAPPTTNPAAGANPAAATAVVEDPNPMTSAFAEGFAEGSR